MALAKLANGIDELHGAIDSVKEGKKGREQEKVRKKRPTDAFFSVRGYGLPVTGKLEIIPASYP